MKKTFSLIIALAMILALVPAVTVHAEVEQIAKWTMNGTTTTTKAGATIGEITAVGTGAIGTVGTNASNYALTCNGWTLNGYFQFVFDGTGYGNYNAVFQMQRSATGPQDFKIETSTDLTSWYPVTGTVPAVGTGATAFNINLNSAMDGSATVYVRLSMPQA